MNKPQYKTPHKYYVPHRPEKAIPVVPLPEPGPAATYPLRISDDRRRLLDAKGHPFLIQGDAAWSIIANLEFADAVRYLDRRKEQGFNTIIVNLVEHLFSKNYPRDLAGREPFSVPGNMGTPNDAYFDAAERVLDACEERGFSVILAPAYVGYIRDRGPNVPPQLDGWHDEIVATGVDGMRKYGEYLGRRFGHYKNIIWCIGGDWHPTDALDGLHAMARAIRAQGVKNLFTAHPKPAFSPIESFPGAEWLDLNVTYTYDIVHRWLLEDYRRKPTWPFFLIESSYEGDQNASDQQIRRQAYWSVLCGGNGHCFGNYPMWLFWDGWKDELDSPGALAMARWGAFFRGIRWADLVPDLGLEFVTGGLGEERGVERVTAAWTADRKMGAAYFPTPRAVDIQLDAFKVPELAIEWFEPKTGRRLSGGTVKAKGEIVLVPPFAEDSMLILGA